MNIERPIYRWFIYGYPNSSSGEGHLGWLFFIGIPWLHFHPGSTWLAQKLLFTVYLHREGLTIGCPPIRHKLMLVHRFGRCARQGKLKPAIKFGAYGLFFTPIENS